MASPPVNPDRELLRRFVETWRRAGVELDAIRVRELQALDTQEAIRQIFGEDTGPLPPAPATSGLVEQQAWFARLRAAKERR